MIEKTTKSANEVMYTVRRPSVSDQDDLHLEVSSTVRRTYKEALLTTTSV